MRADVPYGPADPGRWWTLAAACIASFSLLLNVTVVVVSLQSIGDSLHADFTQVRWVLNGYTVALATLLLGAGSLADRLGHRRVFTTGLFGFLVTSVACAAAPSGEFLVLARIAQGAAAALLFATGLALIGASFVGRERSTAFGIWAATVGAATALGPIVGGAVLAVGSWRWIFLMNVPAALLALAIVGARVRRTYAGSGSPIDWPGQLLAAGGVFLLVLGITEAGERGWGDPRVLGPSISASALLGCFIVVERRTRYAMLDPQLLRGRSAITAAVAGFSLHCSLFAMLVFLTIFLQVVLDYSALEAGLVTLPTAALSIGIGPLAGRIAGRASTGTRIAAGMALIGVGLLSLSGVNGDSSWIDFMPGFLLAGVGVGIANPAIADAALAGTGRERSGTASAINVTFRQLGSAMGIAGLGTVLQRGAEERVAELLSPAHEAGVIETTSDAAIGRPNGIDGGSLQPHLAEIADVAFSTAIDQILVIAAAVALAGAAAGLLARRGTALPASGNE